MQAEKMMTVPVSSGFFSYLCAATNFSLSCFARSTISISFYDLTPSLGMAKCEVRNERRFLLSTGVDC